MSVFKRSQKIRINQHREFSKGTSMGVEGREVKRPALHKGLLCNRAFLYAPHSFLLISNKFWMGGSSAVMLLNPTLAFIGW